LKTLIHICKSLGWGVLFASTALAHPTVEITTQDGNQCWGVAVGACVLSVQHCLGPGDGGLVRGSAERRIDRVVSPGRLAEYGAESDLSLARLERGMPGASSLTDFARAIPKSANRSALKTVEGFWEDARAIHALTDKVDALIEANALTELEMTTRELVAQKGLFTQHTVRWLNESPPRGVSVSLAVPTERVEGQFLGALGAGRGLAVISNQRVFHRGDSGSSLENREGKILGLLSHLLGGAQGGARLLIYTPIAEYLPWLDKAYRDLDC
jgi:hypothetical protein